MLFDLKWLKIGAAGHLDCILEKGLAAVACVCLQVSVFLQYNASMQISLYVCMSKSASRPVPTDDL